MSTAFWLSLLVVVLVLGIFEWAYIAYRLKQWQKPDLDAEREQEAQRRQMEGTLLRQALLAEMRQELDKHQRQADERHHKLSQEMQKVRELALETAMQAFTAPADEGQQHYAEAIQLAKRGHSAERIAERCHIPLGEARVIAAVHGTKPSQPA